MGVNIGLSNSCDNGFPYEAIFMLEEHLYLSEFWAESSHWHFTQKNLTFFIDATLSFRSSTEISQKGFNNTLRWFSFPVLFCSIIFVLLHPLLSMDKLTDNRLAESNHGSLRFRLECV